MTRDRSLASAPTQSALPSLTSTGDGCRPTMDMKRCVTLAPRASKKRHPCKARRCRTPGARDWAPAGVRQGEPQECLRVSENAPHPGPSLRGQCASLENSRSALRGLNSLTEPTFEKFRSARRKRSLVQTNERKWNCAGSGETGLEGRAQ